MSDNETKQRYLALVYKYKDDIYRIILNTVEDRELAKDLRQNVLLNAWKGFHTLKHPEKSKAWVNTITRNVLRKYMSEKKMYLNAAGHEIPSELDDIDKILTIENDILDALVRKEDVKNVFDALKSLKPKYQSIVRDRMFMNMAYDDIAKKYGMNPGTVRVTYSRGLDMLKEAYAILEKGGRLDGQK